MLSYQQNLLIDHLNAVKAGTVQFNNEFVDEIIGLVNENIELQNELDWLDDENEVDFPEDDDDFDDDEFDDFLEDEFGNVDDGGWGHESDDDDCGSGCGCG